MSITLNNFPSSSSKSTGSSMSFTFTNIKNPDSAKPISIKVQFYRSDSLYQESSV
jgi:hypothetical protein